MSKLGNNSPLAGLLGLGTLAGANPGGGVNPHGNTADGIVLIACFCERLVINVSA